MPTNADKSRYVAVKLKIRGRRVPDDPEEYGIQLPIYETPDLTTPAGADLLMTALHKQIEWSSYKSEKNEIRCALKPKGSKPPVVVAGANWRIALFDAAFKMLGGSDDNK
jgi:hypothetical protein